MEFSTALVDADIVSYRCAISAENDGEEVAILRVEQLLQDIIAATGAEKQLCVFSTPRELGFRREIYPEYKLHRDKVSPPKYLSSCKKYIEENWGSVSVPKLEADDILGYKQTKDSVICSIDKDLLQVPGNHYNFVTKQFSISNPINNDIFWRQMLIGDGSDNIPGYDGKLRNKTPNFISHMMQDIVELCYASDTEDSVFAFVLHKYYNEQQFLKNLDLLWVMREENVKCTDREVIKSLLSLHQLQQEGDLKPKSLDSQIAPSMEPTGQDKSGFQYAGNDQDIYDQDLLAL